MAYTINLTDGTIFAVIPDGTINTSSSMTLVGKNYAGYGEVMNEEDTPFKRMIGGMPNPFAPKIQPDNYKQLLPYNSAFDDEDDREYFDSILPIEQGHYYELEKPVDLDEQADQIRKNNENYKVMTGKMKNVKYRN